MGKRIKEYYISVDVEADGPCPGVNSMRQLGAVFYDFDGNVLEEFCVNILPIDGAVEDPDTAKWWTEQEQKRPGLWESITKDAVSAEVAMQRFASCVQKWSGATRSSPVVFAYPAGFDFTFLYWYQCKFLGKSYVGFSALDLKTMGMCLIKSAYHDSAKRRYPRTWFTKKFPHTHNALDDARGQGYMFFEMRKELNSFFRITPTVGGVAIYDDDDTQ